MMSHSPHEGNGLVLNDECDECISRTKFPGISAVDDGNLSTLAALARIIHDGESVPRGMGWADQNAIDELRLMARIVYRSGITEEVAR